LKIISTIQEVRIWRKKISGSLGFIPTMGALHDGHLSLIEESKKLCSKTIVSIYLNPKQFSASEDFSEYPITLDLDIELLSKLNIDAIFVPNDLEIYPKEFSTYVTENKLSCNLEGKSRPHFFQGVTTVVCKLFNIITPSHSFFGDKDAQQLRVIKKMVDDLAYDIKVIACPTIRNKNGLALSSRNTYLSNLQKELATHIFNSLQAGRNLLLKGERNTSIIKDTIYKNLKNAGLNIDYISIADEQTLIEVNQTINTDILVSIAVYLGKTRLIDNFSFKIN
tara:strand:- start:678 stop:1517 length:840 start_codon:yes stop_codon:yes gene_type:complete